MLYYLYINLHTDKPQTPEQMKELGDAIFEVIKNKYPDDGASMSIANEECCCDSSDESIPNLEEIPVDLTKRH